MSTKTDRVCDFEELVELEDDELDGVAGGWSGDDGTGEPDPGTTGSGTTGGDTSGP